MTHYTVKVQFDADALAARCADVFSAAVGVLAEDVMADCEIYVPYDTGQLCHSVSRGDVTEDLGCIRCDIVWSAPHASAVYYGDERGVRYHTGHHAHAQARWFEGAAASCRERWEENLRARILDEL